MQKLRKGFTLVELIIVLAIAGLIISLVFIAATAAQRNGRDTARRADAQKLATAIDQYAANHNGALPSADPTLALFAGGYLTKGKFNDPSTGQTYKILYQTGSLSPQFCFQGYMGYIIDNDTKPTSYHLETCLEAGIYKFTP